MPILDHFIVPSRACDAAAKFLADVLGVRFGDADTLSAVYINDTLNTDFAQRDQFDVHHYCFLVTDEEFDATLARLKEKDISHRSGPHGPMDLQIYTANGGRNLYWFGPVGHNWEILTVSYARPAASLSTS